MGVSTRGRLRRFWFLVHMWIGVGLALVFIPLSLSGSYLVWHDEFDRMLHPARYAVSGGAASLAPSAYIGAAQAAFGDRARVSSLRLPAEAGDPVIVQGQVRSPEGPRGERANGPPRRPQMISAWIDPASARVLDVANPRAGVFIFMHDLHGHLFMIGPGRQIVGWLGWLMLISCISGVWLWWPKAGPLMAGLRWRRGPGVLINLHYLTGFWIAIPLAVLSLTGALISFPPFTRAVFGMVAPVSPQQQGGGGGPGRGGAPVPKTVLNADEAAAAATAFAPGSRIVTLNLPTRGGRDPAWRAQVRKPDGATTDLSVKDQAGGEVRQQPDRFRTSGDKAIRMNRWIHDGTNMPLVWKLIITLAGLIPALLGVTGVIVWAQGQLRKRALRGAGSRPAPQPAE